MSERSRCIEYVYRPGMSGIFGKSTCSNWAKPGSDKCGVHSPEAEAKRKAKGKDRREKQQAEWSATRARAAHSQACVRALANIENPEDAVRELVDAAEMLSGQFGRLREALAPFLAAREKEAVKP